MPRVRLIELICESDEARAQGPSGAPEECYSEIKWIGFADLDDFSKPYFLRTRNIVLEESDGWLEVTYVVEEFDERELKWHLLGYPQRVTTPG